jgi:carotenoid cleavage dioxygenase-like enzyme
MASAEPFEELPFHLRGNYAPVEREVTAYDLPVEGAIPPELCGLYLRNGPNPRTPTPHWFVGDGMIHGARLEAGRAAWFRNRWVRTRTFTEDARWVDDEGVIDRSTGVANTNVIGHAGRILALVESSFPTEVTRELDTVGSFDYAGRLTTAMTAHPKICPLTGELHFFGYSFVPPFLTYHRADAAGRLVQSEEIAVPGPTMMHDFAITEGHVLFMDLPIVFSPERLGQGRFPYAWSDAYGARLGFMPRGGRGADVRWLEIEPCYVFHPLNAYEDGGLIVLDVARYPELWRDSSEQFTSAFLHRFTLDTASGKVSEQALDERPIEFPRVDERRIGLRHRYGYAVTNAGSAADAPQRLIRYDLAGGATREHDFGPGCAPGEGVFVPAGPEASEDEGWVLTYVYDPSRDGSELVILDAARFEEAPVARIALPQRVPFGFHGNWVPDAV